jgi:hypothetical protein
MIYGEHLSADEASVRCPCGIAATVQVFDRHGQLQGWFCRTCSHKARRMLRQQERKIARAVVTKGVRR